MAPWCVAAFALLTTIADVHALEPIQDEELSAFAAGALSLDVEYRLNADASGNWNGVLNKFSYNNKGATEWVVFSKNSGRLYLSEFKFDLGDIGGRPSLWLSFPGKLYFQKWSIDTISVEPQAVAINPSAPITHERIIGFKTDAVWNLNGTAKFFTVTPAELDAIRPY